MFSANGPLGKNSLPTALDNLLLNLPPFKNDVEFKIIPLGNCDTGKSLLLNRLSNLEGILSGMDARPRPTLGAEFRRLNLTHPKGGEDGRKKVSLALWDTCGQERYQSITAGYMRRSDVVLLIFDITNYNSFRNLSVWLEQAKNHEAKKIYVVGSKVDLNYKRVIGKAAAEKWASDRGFSYHEVSSLENIGIQELFTEVLTGLCNKHAMENENRIQKAKNENSLQRSNNNIIKLTDEKNSSSQNSTDAGCCGGGDSSPVIDDSAWAGPSAPSRKP